MNFSKLLLIQIILFNLSIILLYQPNFIFILANIKNKNKVSKYLFFTGLVSLCFLFIISFILGANYILYKKNLIIH
jgi:hypothetical protein